MNEPEVTTERLLTTCPDGKVCPAVVSVSSRPGYKAIVGLAEMTDAERTALARHIGTGEGALFVPDELLDLIRKGLL